MKVEQARAIWNIVDDGRIIHTCSTNAEAWRWLERHELDPPWVSGRRMYREGVEEYRSLKSK